MPTFLVVDIAQFRCAFAVADVVETMRPLPVEPASGAPDYVLGLAIIRGEAVPVVDVARLIKAEPKTPTRFVSLRAGERVVAAAVTAVHGVVDIHSSELQEMPALLSAQSSDAIAIKDGELLRILSGARLLDESTLRRIADGAYAD